MRVVLSLTALAAVSVTIVDYSWGISTVGRWLQHAQIGQSLTAITALWLVFWIVVTLCFGRIYCSSVCPLGTVQDITSALRRRAAKGSRRFFQFTAPRPQLRFFMMALGIAAVVFSLSSLLTVLDPYKVYASTLSLAAGNGAVMAGASLGGLIAAAVVFAAVAIVAAWRGRSLCNTMCPVGALLSLPARVSALHFDINTDLCTNCYDCVHVCKAGCIDLKDHVVDTARCVACFNCSAACENGAITYRRGRHRLQMPLMQQISTSATPMASSDISSSTHCSKS